MNTLEYRYPVESLGTGSSLGNLHAFARCDERTDLLGLWIAADNQYYLGEWNLTFVVDGVAAKPEHTVFRPESQTTIFRAGDVVIEKTLFLPLFPDGEKQPTAERAVIFLVDIRNNGRLPVDFTVHHSLTFPGLVTEKFTKQPAADQLEKRVSVRISDGLCVATTVGRPMEARVFGGDTAWSAIASSETSLTVSFDNQIPGGTDKRLSFRFVGSPHGADEAITAFSMLADTGRMFTQTKGWFRSLVSRSIISTPDPVINRSLQWAKINMMRVCHEYRVGEAFTNDPPQDIVVIRDLAWFTLGMDTLSPGHSRRMLDLACNLGAVEGGKMAEYFHADEAVPVLHDYRLNINDDTPLFVWALAHHAWVTGDRDFLKRAYPVMVQACEWILGQTVDGLVRCTGEGTNVWGICSWRNIIDEYALVGAVTEINAECLAALEMTAEAAHVLGDDDSVRKFSGAAQTLRMEINACLRSGRTGLYLLNLDNHGVEHHDVTGDLVFPVMLGAAEDGVKESVLKRLTGADFWTPYGARTVPPGEAIFDPERGYQLVGGVWPNLTAWIAYSLRAEQPEKVAEAMRNIYRIVEEDIPVDHGFVVPGEFPERLHGTDFHSRGMTLSPWTPPTYHWLGVEGLLGLHCTSDGVELNPALPESWQWIAVKDLPLLGSTLSAFLFHGTVYASMKVNSRLPVVVGKRLETATDVGNIMVIALAVAGEVVVFISGSEKTGGIIRYEWNGMWSELPFEIGRAGAEVIREPYGV
ncbi:MAG: hypothetical protein WB699_14855 [Bacteroidota bacterium]